jgi:UDPglucose--hexose-1-phosphate uridylyltransferase
MNGVGAHEVIIETPEHSESLVDFDVNRVADVLFVCQGRMIDLERDPRFRYLMLFKNQGEAAGASLEHSHSQLIATPVVPKRVLEELEGCKRYYGYKERCIFCDIIRQELHDSDRVIEETEDFVSISPFAARFPYETWILPKSHQGAFRTTTPRDLNGLAEILLSTLQRVKWALNDPAYNFMLHTTPIDGAQHHQYHWHIELIPKLTRVAGFEWGTGFYINPTSPEEAAERLRNADSHREAAVTPPASETAPAAEGRW